MSALHFSIDLEDVRDHVRDGHTYSERVPRNTERYRELVLQQAPDSWTHGGESFAHGSGSSDGVKMAFGSVQSNKPLSTLTQLP